MKKHLITLAATLVVSAHTFAASSVDLTVTGLITPSACTPALSGGGVVDHGKISAKDLEPATSTLLPSKFLQMTVTCDAPTQFAIKGIDNSTGSDDPNGYGLGLINGDQKLGNFMLEFLSATADGSVTSLLKSYDNGTSWEEMDGEVWVIQSLASFGSQSGGNWTPGLIKDLTADLKVYTTIAPTNGLDLTNEALIDGRATLEVKYL